MKNCIIGYKDKNLTSLNLLKSIINYYKKNKVWFKVECIDEQHKINLYKFNGVNLLLIENGNFLFLFLNY